MPTAAAMEITPRSHWKARSSGSISTPGAERRPAAAIRATNTVPAATKA